MATTCLRSHIGASDRSRKTSTADDELKDDRLTIVFVKQSSVGAALKIARRRKDAELVNYPIGWAVGTPSDTQGLKKFLRPSCLEI